MPALPFLSVDPALLASAMSFLFVFAIVFALLSYSKMFVQKDEKGEPKGKEPRGTYLILALIFGAVAASYEPVTTLLQSVIPPFAIFLVGVFFLVFIRDIFRRKKPSEEADPLRTLVVLAIFLIVLWAFWNEISAITGISGLISPENAFYLIAIIIIVLIFWIVSRAETKRD